MTQIGEGIAITQVRDPDDDHWAQIEYTYADGTPVQGMFTAVDGGGMTWTGYLNDQGQACLSGLPPGAVTFQLLPKASLADELADLRKQIKTVLDNILAEQRAEAKAHEEALAQQSLLGRTYSHYAAVQRGFWNGALGLLTFAKDVVVKAGEAAVFLSPVTRLNNLLHASYTSYTNGELTQDEWRRSLSKNYQEEEFKDLATMLGFDIRNISREQVLSLMTEAYEIVAYIADDAECREMFLQFGKDYAGAQSSVEWAEFAGGGLFEIVLTALLLVFTGGLGNAAQAASKVRHAGRLRSLGGLLRKLGQLLRRKKLSKKVKSGVDTKLKVKAEKPEGKKLNSGANSKEKSAVPEVVIRKPLTAAQIDEISNLSPHGIKAQTILLGENGKVAVIGRSMGDLKNASRGGEAGVVDYARELRAKGYQTELFAGPQIKQEWFDEIAALRKEYGVDILPDEVIYETTFYKENIKWAEKLRRENYTVVDIGNPNRKAELGPFYGGELKTVFGGAPSEKLVDLTGKNKY